MLPHRNDRDFKLFGLIGMRVIKTFIAIYLCFLIALFRENSPLYSIFAALISMKSDTDESIETGISRVIGNIIGGLFGFFTLITINHLDIPLNTHAHYLIVSILIVPLIYINNWIHSPTSTTTSSVVFLSIVVSKPPDISTLAFAVERVVETSIGVIVALLVNIFL